MPVAISRREAAPFAALFGNVQYRVEHLEVMQFHIPTLNREAVLDLLYCSAVISINSNYNNLTDPARMIETFC
jgi:UDP-N-acetylmuramyl pentapeptide phosphotransferase/UDP-N-acetylglucosamine-1-phosphate transferase